MTRGKPLEIRLNRRMRKYPLRIQLMRVAWGIAQVFFRLTPRPLYGPKRWMLRLFGAKIGARVHVASSARIYFPWNLTIGAWSSIGEHALIYNLGAISIGQSVTISQRAHLCAGSHDYSDPLMPLLKQPIRIGDQSWICADSFVGPGVAVGEGAVVGACAAVFKDVEAWMVVRGNPSVVIKKRNIQAADRPSA